MARPKVQAFLALASRDAAAGALDGAVDAQAVSGLMGRSRATARPRPRWTPH
jgi:hypothetical protein